MKNVRYIIKDDFQADKIAEDLKVQLEVNRQGDVSITSIKNRNEVIVQIPEANDSLEEILSSFMHDYQEGVALE